MDLPKRKQLRLSGFDYSSNHYYFVTICTHHKTKLFGMGDTLSPCGLCAKRALLQIPQHFSSVKVDTFVIMPNHVHAIFAIDYADTKPCNLSHVIGLYKSAVSKQIHMISDVETIWQKSFYDHIIRNDREYQEIWNYIDENPLKWELDELYRP